jgi:signal transduction histidine kinase/ligand-binding sensor domain-containing protein/DNA-binding response OmpR family regulator
MMNLGFPRIGIVLVVSFSMLLLPDRAGCQNPNYYFKQLTTQDGLSSNDVRAVFEDSNGFMWFATSDGLNRWDGYKFIVFKNYNNELNSLPGNFLLCLAEDSSKNIWIGTNHGGVVKYNTLEEKFYTYSMIVGDESSIPGLVVRSIYVDIHNDVWVGTHSGLAKYLPKTNTFKRFNFPSENPGAFADIRQIIQLNKNELIIQCDLGLFKMDLNNEHIHKYEIYSPGLSLDAFKRNYPICFDSKGFLWIGLATGLIKLDIKSGKFATYQPDPKVKNSINSNNYSFIFEDSRKNIWIGTENRGVNLYDPKTDGFTQFTAGIYNKNSISNNIISNIYEDRSSNIWFSTLEGGVSYFSNKSKQFEYFCNDPLDNSSLSSNKIGAFYEDNDGTVWIGAEDGGLNKFLPKEGKFIRYHLKTDYIAPSILNIKKNSENSLYITGLRIGLYSFNKETEKFSNLMGNIQLEKFQPINHIKDLGIDSKGNVWMTTHDKEGIMVYIPKTRTFYNSVSPGPFNKEILSVPYAASTIEDSKGRIWVISYLGLFMLDSTVHTFLSDNNNTNTISSNYLYTLFEDSKKNIWIGSSKGLDRLIEGTEGIRFERCSEKYSLPSSILGILEDNYGNLWLSSNQGITKFDPGTKKIRDFNIINGTETIGFSERLCYKGPSGIMYFGGTNGFIRFNPDSMNKQNLPSDIYIVDFQLFTVSQKADGKSPLKKSIIYTKDIELNYDQSVLSFEFTALDYEHGGALEFAYIMEGFDEKWNYVGDKHFATYTNLSPGKYTFRVKTTDGNQLSNGNGASINIRVKPPFWRTDLAYIIYFLLFVVLLYLFRNAIINREKLKNELQLEKNEIKSVREANMMKLRFFTNISHEFRTPLTLIKAPIEKLIGSNGQLLQEDVQYLFNIIQSNTDKLSKMVNQLLDYRKLEAGSLVLEPSEGDIVDFCRKSWAIFNLMASQKKVKYTFQTSIDSQMMSFDADKIDKIVTNLLSNALKFTSEGGQVTLSIEKIKEHNKTFNESKPYVLISVTDTGIGIPEKEVNQIFDRFYTVSHTGPKKFEGTGIGLTLVKELTELHQGEISVKSRESVGSEFIVKIPIIMHGLDESKYPIKKQKYETEKTVFSGEDIDRIIDGKPLLGKYQGGKHKILVIEDDDELRHYLKNELIDTFDVLEANDGHEGLEMAFFSKPELVVSDIMMPHINGIDLCKRIKSDERTSHLPVILLTALHSQENQIEGLASGADDYIVKPFNIILLKTRITNLLNTRNELNQRFKNSTSLYFENESANEKDQKLIQSIIDIVLDNISNEKINADFIAKKLLISRSLIYIKIEGLTGQSVNEFIRNIRLKKSTTLLRQKNSNITDIAYSVGFSSQSYFTRCFTKRFGKSPKDFAIENFSNSLPL